MCSRNMDFHGKPISALKSNYRQMIPKTMFRFILIAGITLMMHSCGIRSDDRQPVFEQRQMNTSAKGSLLEIKLVAGPDFNHPLMAIWLEDLNNRFIQTLFVAESIGKGEFAYGKQEKGQWLPGEIQRPSALPVWSHKSIKEKNRYGNYLPTPENPVADAYTGATPLQSFIMKVTTEKEITRPVKIMLEINQAFDWNEHWTNNKYPADDDYKTSAQPAVIYSATIRPESTDSVFVLEPIGNAHYSGDNGNIYQELSTISTRMVRLVQVKIVD